MQKTINYYNQHAQAEAQGMAVDWRTVANSMAKQLAADLQELQAAKQLDKGKQPDAPGDQAEQPGDQEAE